jgi:ribosomal protein S18 acetylase RimI-like enzyme
MSEIEIRDATSADAPGLGKLAAELVDLHYRFDPLRFIQIENAAVGYGRFLGSRAGDPKAFVLVAIDDGNVVGYTYAAMEGKDWNDLRDPAGMLHDIYVDATYRRRGVARKLALAAFARLEKMGAPRIVLKTAAKNETAQKFFASLGFRDTMIEMTREASMS